MPNISIRVFNTHIEIYPYEKGQCPAIENLLSRNEMVYRSHGRPIFRKEPFGYYILNDIQICIKYISCLDNHHWIHSNICTKGNILKKMKTKNLI